jgi:PEP-CTERM motif
MVRARYETISNMNRKRVLTAMVLVGLTSAAFGQGWIAVDNSISIGAVTVDTAGNWYAGPYGVEIWAKSGAIGDNINSFNGQPGGAVSAYANLAADRYVLGGTFANKNMSVGTIANVGTARFTNINPGPNAVAVVAWNSSAPSFSAAVAGGAKAGVYTFINGFYIGLPPPTTLGDGWGSTDLVMTTVPEPGTWALAGLCAAALLIMSRKKQSIIFEGSPRLSWSSLLQGQTWPTVTLYRVRQQGTAQDLPPVSTAARPVEPTVP